MDWSPTNIARLQELDDAGLSAAQIGRKMGCPKDAVAAKLSRLRESKTATRAQFTDEMDAVVRAMHKAGAKSRAIAQKLGVSENAVRWRYWALLLSGGKEERMVENHGPSSRRSSGEYVLPPFHPLSWNAIGGGRYELRPGPMPRPDVCQFLMKDGVCGGKVEFRSYCGACAERAYIRRAEPVQGEPCGFNFGRRVA